MYRRGVAARSRFFYVRVTILLTVLAGVLLWAWADVRSRRARNTWDHTLYVAIAVVRLERVDDGAIAAMQARLPALEDRLAAEMTRYRLGAPRPVRFSLVTPVDATSPPPLPEGDGPVDAVKHSFALSAYLKDVDARAGIDASIFDARIYVAVRRTRREERTLVEGRSEQGGRVGLVEVELDAESGDLPLIVVAHELLHTLGATDKYDGTGRTLVPLGLAEPERDPLYPQRFAEIMSRNLPLSPSTERVPEGFGEVAVGRATAREIGWEK